jgi:hypothetical protein
MTRPDHLCFVLANGECVSPFECVHGPADPRAVAALTRLGETVPTPRGLFAKGVASTALIPVADLQVIAERYKLAQVILVAWDGSREHVVTYGSTLGDADNAAQGGNVVKDALRWPPDRYSTSDRVATMVERTNALLDQITKMGMEPFAGHTYWREVASLRDFLVSEGLRS